MKTVIRYCKTHQKDRFLTVEGCPGCLVMLVDDNAALRAENARLREALEEIGFRTDHGDQPEPCPICEIVDRALSSVRASSETGH